MTRIIKICCCGSKDHVEVNDTNNMELRFVCNKCKSVSKIDYGSIIIDLMKIPKVEIKEQPKEAKE